MGLLISGLASCITYQKVLPNYLQGTNDTLIKNAPLPPPLRIKKNDQLFIQMYSESTIPETDAPYNLPPLQSGGEKGENANFLVDENGNIIYPTLGKIHAEGLTRNQLADLIQQKLAAKRSKNNEPELTNPSVIVKMVNLNVTVLGAVTHPGNVPIQGERLNLLEALGGAGDILEYGDRTKVKVIRKTGDSITTTLLDLTKPDFFQSPYYNLQQNDVLMVDNTTIKVENENAQKKDTFKAQLINIGFSFISSIAFIYSVFFKKD